jgi:hypothetical protein
LAWISSGARAAADSQRRDIWTGTPALDGRGEKGALAEGAPLKADNQLAASAGVHGDELHLEQPAETGSKVIYAHVKRRGQRARRPHQHGPASHRPQDGALQGGRDHGQAELQCDEDRLQPGPRAKCAYGGRQANAYLLHGELKISRNLLDTFAGG